LAGRLDLDRVGVFGMSSGGTAAHMTCVVDARCRAGLNMDGFQPLLIDLPSLRTPFMHMSRATVFTNAIAQEQSQGLSYIVRVEGARHTSFTDNVLTLHRLKYLGALGDFLGTIDGVRMVHLVNDYALAFFDESMRGQHDEPLDGLSERYPETSVLSRAPQAGNRVPP
jgi:predicted dienelactone hydrolase